ncbi:MAG: 30S ribosomal protein S7 [Planctomycetota bacterium]|jgi:small subunit ribosomal protein S7|nr:30S ribosomal protein S7 [Planctomycetota bacterium]
MSGRITKSDMQLKPDPRYGDLVLSRFINCMMHGGNKSTAIRVVYNAFDEIQKRLDDGKAPDLPETALEVFHLALDNVRPQVEVRSKRVGGANYQVPMQLNRRRQQSLTFRWIIVSAREERGKPIHLRLAKELWDAAHNEGKSVTTRENTHRMAEANRAFAHFGRNR